MGRAKLAFMANTAGNGSYGTQNKHNFEKRGGTWLPILVPSLRLFPSHENTENLF